jgi:acylphosphatase
MSHITRRFRIVGKVQGVYFRHSTRVQAQRLGIAGYASNLPDGSVEVLAHGPVQVVEELLGWLHRGPENARVDAVTELAVESARPVESEPGAEAGPEREAGLEGRSGPDFEVR